MSAGINVIRQKRGPVYVEWEIKNYFAHTAENEHLESSDFYFYDKTPWWLRLYPNGETKNPDYISFFLMRGESNKEYDISYKLGLMKPNDSVLHAVEYDNIFKENYAGYGCGTFFLRSELLKSKDAIAINDVLRVFCIIRFTDNTVKETACGTCSPKSLEILTRNYKDLYLGGQLCDVTVTVKDKDFHAHKSILVARSPVFATMFKHDMLEKFSSTVNITDCDPDSFNEFLLFLYTGKLENVSPSIPFGLYETANKYDVKELQEECVKLMEHNLSVDTFSDAVLVSTKYNESKLLKCAIGYFENNVKKILPTVKWQLFMAEYPYLANELFIKLFKIKSNVRKFSVKPVNVKK